MISQDVVTTSLKIALDAMNDPCVTALKLSLATSSEQINTAIAASKEQQIAIDDEANGDNKVQCAYM